MDTVEPTQVNAKPGLTTERAGSKESWIEVLRDGTHVMIRPIHKQDIELERRFIERMSQRSRHFRFLEEMRSPSDELLKQMTTINPANQVAYIALIAVGAEKRQIGVARFSANVDESNCEFAVTVSDAWQKKGLGRLLMRHLIDAAQARGIESMYSNDSADNDLMRKFAEHLGLQYQRDPHDATQITYSLDLKQASLEPNSVV